MAHGMRTFICGEMGCRLIFQISVDQLQQRAADEAGVVECPLCDGEAFDNTSLTTVDVAAAARGIVHYDAALPQGWVDAMRDRHGVDVRGKFVWCYDDDCGGCPMSVCREGDTLAARFIAVAAWGVPA